MKIKEIEITERLSIELGYSLVKNDVTIVTPCAILDIDKYEMQFSLYLFFVCIGFIYYRRVI
jgi:hypothetical protein